MQSMVMSDRRMSQHILERFPEIKLERRARNVPDSNRHDEWTQIRTKSRFVHPNQSRHMKILNKRRGVERRVPLQREARQVRYDQARKSSRLKVRVLCHCIGVFSDAVSSFFPDIEEHCVT